MPGARGDSISIKTGCNPNSGARTVAIARSRTREAWALMVARGLLKLIDRHFFIFYFGCDRIAFHNRGRLVFYHRPDGVSNFGLSDVIKKSKYANESIRELLDKLNPLDVLVDLGIESDSIERDESGFVAPCPAHSNGSDMTLVYESDRKRAYCREFKCPASKVTGGGGDLAWLYALVKQTSYDTAIEFWSRRMNVHLKPS